MFDLHIITLVIGFIAGSITALKLSAWWFNRKIAGTRTKTRKEMAAKLAAL
jgi:FtsZ-interacting cell division protein ZipA